jgi:hypothetical protein
MSLPCYFSRIGVLLAAVAMAAGCQQAEKIQSYPVPKERQAATASAVAGAAADPAAATTPTDRMLVAIVPEDGEAWFFKVVGPIATIDEHEKAIRDFFATIRPPAGRQQPSWELPAGWSEKPGSMMRLATIMVPTADKPLEIAVTSLGWTGQPADVLMNVNRWRGQVQLPPTGEAQLAESLRELPAVDNKYTMVDLRGRFQAGGMTAPFAGLPPGGIEGGGNPPPPGVANDLSAGHPPIGPAESAPSDEPPAVNADPAVPKFDMPATWQAVTPANSMRKAEFNLADGGKTAKVTLSDFSGQAPKIADPLENVNRWRGEVGLSPLAPEAIDANIETIEVDGQPATFAAMIPDPATAEQSQAGEATLGAIVPRGERVWFIKLRGDRDLVAGQVDAFKAFMKSLRFADGRGANNGN